MAPSSPFGSPREKETTPPDIENEACSHEASIPNGDQAQETESNSTLDLHSITTRRSERLPPSLARVESTISAIRNRRHVPAFTHPLAHVRTGSDVIVDFDGPDDPYLPLNWLFKKKLVTTFLYAFTTMGAAFASSVYSPAVAQIAREFDVGVEVALLGISLFLLGFAFGPMLWAPLSEIYGRKWTILGPYMVAGVFSFATATAKDIQTVMITRFFSGFCAAASISNTGAVMSDMWSIEQRAVSVAGYALAVVAGPTLGPIVGGAICHSSLGWRWTEYVTGIYMLFISALDVLFLDESYHEILLVSKARRLRHESGNWALHARHEEREITLQEMGRTYLIRPFRLLATPICFCFAMYASFVYGILYANLAAFPIEFQEERGWNQVVGALPFLAFLTGMIVGAAINLSNQRYYTQRFRLNGNIAVPEARLPPMMIGSVFFAAGLFLFAWTSGRRVHWIAPCVGSALIGIGFFTIFQAALNYLIDTFQRRYAASAIAANTFLRSLCAAAFPLFIRPMLHSLGIDWGVSVFAFVAVALLPIPFLFFLYGKRIRNSGAWSKGSVRGPIAGYDVG